MTAADWTLFYLTCAQVGSLVRNYARKWLSEKATLHIIIIEFPLFTNTLKLHSQSGSLPSSVVIRDQISRGV